MLRRIWWFRGLGFRVVCVGSIGVQGLGPKGLKDSGLSSPGS